LLDEKTFAGASSCRSCHIDAHAQWRTHGHARAMKSLVDSEMHFNRDCLKCHSTGFGQPGGSTDLRVTANLASVQCEVCHGPAENHVRNMRAAEQLTREGKPVPPMEDDLVMEWDANFCMQCHDQNNDPDFNFAVDFE